MTHPDPTILGSEHVAIISPDDRKRFPLGRFVSREGVTQWRVYRSPDGRHVLLEAIVEAADV